MKQYLALLLLGSMLVSSTPGQKLSKKERQRLEELSLDPDPKKRKKDERPQALEPLKEPPQAIAVEAQKLGFLVAPLSGKGLLSQQVRDALRSLFSSTRGATIVKLRAFVAGTGDMRRVQAIVSETFTEKRLPLPVLTVVQVGALPGEGVQLAMEAIVSDRREASPHGVAFVPAQGASVSDAVAPLQALRIANVRKVTCYLDSIEHAESVRNQIVKSFPEAAANVVQLRRDSSGDFVACEASAELEKAPEKPFSIPGPVASFGPGKIVLSGAQMAFGSEEKDLRLAFGRLDKALESAGTDSKQVAYAHVYALTRSAAEGVTKLQREYFPDSPNPAVTSLIFEGLPSLDASTGIDVIALAK